MNEWVWSNGGMILTGENWSTGRKTLYSVGGRWMNEYGAMVEWYWQGETLKYTPREKNLFQRHFVHHKSDTDWSGIELLSVAQEMDSQIPEPAKVISYRLFRETSGVSFWDALLWTLSVLSTILFCNVKVLKITGIAVRNGIELQ